MVVVGVLYLSFADLGWFKPGIESAVAEATGRQLQLGGDFDLDLDLDLDILPAPAIVLENVSLPNAEGGGPNRCWRLSAMCRPDWIYGRC